MFNQNKTVTAGADGFTVYYLDQQKHFNHKYHLPLLPKLQELQLYGDSYNGKRYQDFERDEFSPYQSRLYKDAVYGLSNYSLEDLKKLSLSEKVAIRKTNRLAQQVLNLWKQEIVSRLVDDFLLSVFHHSKLVKDMVDNQILYDQSLLNGFDFADLGITRKDIATKLIETNILPSNFFYKQKVA